MLDRDILHIRHTANVNSDASTLPATVPLIEQNWISRQLGKSHSAQLSNLPKTQTREVLVDLECRQRLLQAQHCWGISLYGGRLQIEIL